MLVLRAVYNVSFRVKSYSFCISVFWNADIALSLSIVLRQLCYMHVKSYLLCGTVSYLAGLLFRTPSGHLHFMKLELLVNGWTYRDEELL